MTIQRLGSIGRFSSMVAVITVVLSWSAIFEPAMAQSTSVTVQFSGVVEQSCSLVLDDADDNLTTSGCSYPVGSLGHDGEQFEGETVLDSQAGGVLIWEEQLPVESLMVAESTKSHHGQRQQGTALNVLSETSMSSVRRVTLVPQ